MKPHFYKTFVDDMYMQRKKNEPDNLLKSNHLNIKLTIEKNPVKF